MAKIQNSYYGLFLLDERSYIFHENIIFQICPAVPLGVQFNEVPSILNP